MRRRVGDDKVKAQNGTEVPLRRRRSTSPTSAAVPLDVVPVRDDAWRVPADPGIPHPGRSARRNTMKRPAVTLALSIVVLALLVAVGLHEPAAQDVGEIKLGAFAPISGATADVGAQIKAGAEVAVERFNE